MQIVPPIKLPPVMTSSLTILRAKFVGGQPHFQFAQCILPPLFSGAGSWTRAFTQKNILDH